MGCEAKNNELNLFGLKSDGRILLLAGMTKGLDLSA